MFPKSARSARDAGESPSITASPVQGPHRGHASSLTRHERAQPYCRRNLGIRGGCDGKEALQATCSRLPRTLMVFETDRGSRLPSVSLGGRAEAGASAPSPGAATDGAFHGGQARQGPDGGCQFQVPLSLTPHPPNCLPQPTNPLLGCWNRQITRSSIVHTLLARTW